MSGPDQNGQVVIKTEVPTTPTKESLVMTVPLVPTTQTIVKSEPVGPPSGPVVTTMAGLTQPQVKQEPVVGGTALVMSPEPLVNMPMGIQLPTQPLPQIPVQLPTQPVPITAAAQAMAQAAGLPPGTQAAIVEGEDGEQQIYIIQTADGSEIPVEGAEIVVAGNAGMAMPVAAPGGTGEEQVFETVSALEQLSRSGHVVTEGGELLQVYEEVVLPDGTSAKLDESGEVVTTDSNGVGGLTHPGVGSLSLPTTPLPPHSLPVGQFVAAAVADGGLSLGGQEAAAALAGRGQVGELTCMDCGKLFKSKRSLFGHRKEKHSGVLENHTCPECGKSFGRKSNLKAHRESLHYGKKFPCVYCERIFTNRSSMNQHIKKTHQGSGAVMTAGGDGSAATSPPAVDNGTDNGQTVIWHPQTTVMNI